MNKILVNLIEEKKALEEQLEKISKEKNKLYLEKQVAKNDMQIEWEGLQESTERYENALKNYRKNKKKMRNKIQNLIKKSNIFYSEMNRNFDKARNLFSKGKYKTAISFNERGKKAKKQMEELQDIANVSSQNLKKIEEKVNYLNEINSSNYRVFKKTQKTFFEIRQDFYQTLDLEKDLKEKISKLDFEIRKSQE